MGAVDVVVLFYDDDRDVVAEVAEGTHDLGNGPYQFRTELPEDVRSATVSEYRVTVTRPT